MSPEYSEKSKKKIKEILSHYPQKEAALLPVLHLTQREFGCISPTEEKLVAAALEIKPIRVREAVTFYSMLNRQSTGKYHIQVCSNLSCTLLGAESLIDHLKQKLGIEPGQTTSDNKFTLTTVECLGACEEAPAIMINFDYFGQLDQKRIDDILDKLK